MPLYADITQDHDLERNKARADAYKNYLQKVAAHLPAETKEFVLSEWYYADFDRCPHDAWVESLEILEPSSGDRHEKRELEIRLKLLAASHAGFIHFHYKGVSHYRLDGELHHRGGKKHGDWLSDEITLASDGKIQHEILFSSGTTWMIRCSSVAYNYVPIHGKKQGPPWANETKSALSDRREGPNPECDGGVEKRR